jgi:hypothetical protein
MIIAYTVVAVLDTSKLFKSKEYGKLAVYYSLMIISAAVGTLISMGVEIPSPAKAIADVVKVITGE